MQQVYFGTAVKRLISPDMANWFKTIYVRTLKKQVQKNHRAKIQVPVQQLPDSTEIKLYFLVHFWHQDGVTTSFFVPPWNTTTRLSVSQMQQMPPLPWQHRFLLHVKTEHPTDSCAKNLLMLLFARVVWIKLL